LLQESKIAAHVNFPDTGTDVIKRSDIGWDAWWGFTVQICDTKDIYVAADGAAAAANVGILTCGKGCGHGEGGCEEAGEGEDDADV